MAKDVAPPLRDGRYRLVAMVGSGASASVYRAFDTRLSVYRAIKLLHDKFRSDPRTRHRFEEEAAVIASLRHTNIVTVYDIDIDAGKPFIVMDYAPGGSLMQRVDRLGALEPSAAVHILVDVLDALQVAHQQGIVHRDIKPHNILFGIDDVPLLTDFGVALRIEERWTPRTQAQIMGTPSYMAPEQAANPEMASPRSDIYSLGLSMYVLLTGRQPFRPHEVDEARRELCMVDAELAAIALKACSPQPTDRYMSAAEMADALCEVAARLPPFRAEFLHSPGTAPLRYLAPPTVPPMEATWPPLTYDERGVPAHTGPPREQVDPYLELESMPSPPRTAGPVSRPPPLPVNRSVVLALLVIFITVASATWLVVGRVGQAFAAMAQ